MCNVLGRSTPFLFPFKEVSKLPENVIAETIYTENGSFDFIQTVTLGEALIALSVFLLLSFLILQWLLETVWRSGRR